jgi:hypothetical protein
MVKNYNHLSLYNKAEEVLKSIIDINLKKNAPPQVLYNNYNNLFLHYLRADLNRSILFGKALLSESERYLVPMKY